MIFKVIKIKTAKVYLKALKTRIEIAKITKQKRKFIKQEENIVLSLTKGRK